MLDWILTLTMMALFAALAFFAHSKIGTVRADERPHQLPWRLIMIGCVFAIFMAIVHILNLVGLETGPEHGPFGRF